MTTDDSPAFVCVMTYTGTHPDGVPYVFNEGNRLDADHPEVAKFPAWWAPENKPSVIEEKRRAAWADSYVVPQDDTPAAIITTPYSRALKSFSVDLDGEQVSVKKGETPARW